MFNVESLLSLVCYKPFLAYHFFAGYGVFQYFAVQHFAAAQAYGVAYYVVERVPCVGIWYLFGVYFFYGLAVAEYLTS